MCGCLCVRVCAHVCNRVYALMHIFERRPVSESTVITSTNLNMNLYIEDAALSCKPEAGLNFSLLNAHPKTS